MIDKIKAFAIGLGIIVLGTLFIVGLFSGGALSLVLSILIIFFGSYFIGSTFLDLYRSNKDWKNTYEGS